MRKIFLIGNGIYLPFESIDGKIVKYVSGSISGDIFLSDIYTEEEIRAKASAQFPLVECKNLHEIIQKWGAR